MDENLEEIDARKQRTVYQDGPPYKATDDASLLAFVADALVEPDRVRPCETISVSAFAPTAVCVDAAGRLVAPITDHLAEPPEGVAQGCNQIAPPLSEVFANTSPSALNLACRLCWIETEFPDAFARSRRSSPGAPVLAFAIAGHRGRDRQHALRW